MVQYVDIKTYHRMVDECGIERAYDQRFRCTGRTKRLVLRTLASLSQGDSMYAEWGEKGKPTYQMYKMLLRDIRDLAVNYMPDLEWVFRESSIECKTSGGKLVLHQVGADTRGHWQLSKSDAYQIKDEM